MSLLLWLTTALASPQASFDEGIAALREGRHDEAIAAFEQALDDGGQDPAVYHGLGNALYRSGQRGRAMAAWERALRLAPRDGDVRANLDRARRESADRLDAPSTHLGPFFWQGSLATRESGTAASLLLSVCLWLLVWARVRGGRPGFTAWASGASGLLLLAGTIVAEREDSTAVVVVEQASVRSDLGPDGIELFVLHEGAEVRVVERTSDYALIALPDSRKGWLPATVLISATPGEPFDVL